MRVQEFFQRSRSEQIALYELKKLLHGQPEAAVEGHDGTFGQYQGAGYAAFADLGIGGGRKRRDMTVMVRQGVHLDAAFCLAERSPGEKRQAEPDGGGVQAKKFGFEAGLVFRSFGRAQAAQAVACGTSCGKPHEGHGRELVLEAEHAQGRSGIAPVLKFLENMSGNER